MPHRRVHAFLHLAHEELPRGPKPEDRSPKAGPFQEGKALVGVVLKPPEAIVVHPLRPPLPLRGPHVDPALPGEEVPLPGEKGPGRGLPPKEKGLPLEGPDP